MGKFFKKIGSKLKSFCKENPMLCVFVAVSVINGFMLRAFTVRFAYNQIKPLMADTAVMLILAAFFSGRICMLINIRLRSRRC